MFSVCPWGGRGGVPTPRYLPPLSRSGWGYPKVPIPPAKLPPPSRSGWGGREGYPKVPTPIQVRIGSTQEEFLVLSLSQEFVGAYYAVDAVESGNTEEITNVITTFQKVCSENKSCVDWF